MSRILLHNSHTFFLFCRDSIYYFSWCIGVFLNNTHILIYLQLLYQCHDLQLPMLPKCFISVFFNKEFKFFTKSLSIPLLIHDNLNNHSCYKLITFIEHITLTKINVIILVCVIMQKIMSLGLKNALA